MLVAGGLWRGTRRAAVVAAIAVAALGVAGIVHGETAGPSIEFALTGLLLVARPLFPRGAARDGIAGPAVSSRSPPSRVGDRRADARAHRPGGGLAAATRWLLDGTWWLSSKAAPALVLDLLVVGALAAAGLLIARLLRPHASHEGHSGEEHTRAAALVATHGADSLDPFSLRPDKAFHFAAGGFLAYRTVRGTAVISGDPIGPDGAAPEILESFTAEANRRGWSVAMTGAGGRYLRAIGVSDSRPCASGRRRWSTRPGSPSTGRR